jgi:hypothetical protein
MKQSICLFLQTNAEQFILQRETEEYHLFRKKKQRTCVFDREKHSTAFVLLREKQSICFFQREAEHIFCPIALLVENVL